MKQTVNGTILCVINEKGGVGKSSTCFHLAGTLASQGYDVLLVDTDPQGSISRILLGSTAVHQLPLDRTLAQIFVCDVREVAPEDLVIETGIANVSLIPANQHLAEFNIPRPEASGVNQFTLREFLERQHRARVVLIDCPPNLYQSSWNALLAASHVVVPVPPEDLGTQGLRAIHQAIQQAQTLNPGLRRLGHLITRYDRRLTIHRAYVERLRKRFPELVFKTQIPEAVAFKVAITARQPVEIYDCNSSAAKAMQSLVSEIESRTSRDRNSHAIANQ